MSSTDWRGELRLIPTRNQTLLRSTIGRTIAGLTRYDEMPPIELLAFPPYADRGIAPSQLFSLASGPVEVLLETAGAVCVGNSEPLLSLTIAPANRRELEEYWATRIDATDPVYSEGRFGSFVGARIETIRVLQWFLDPNSLVKRDATGRIVRYTLGKAIDRPREAVLIFELNTGGKLVFATNLVDAPGGFAVLTEEDIAGVEAAAYPEILVLRDPATTVAT
jgi:hypothetical protein